MSDINLALGSQYIAAARRRQRNIYLLAILILLVLLGGWLVLLSWKERANQNLMSVTSELNAVEAEITRSGSDVERIQLFEGRLAVLDKLLTRHISWADLFDSFERLLPPETVLTSIKTANNSATVDISGLVPSIDMLSQTLASLGARADRATMFKSGGVKSVTQKRIVDDKGVVTATQYEFTGGLTLAPKTAAALVGK